MVPINIVIPLASVKLPYIAPLHYLYLLWYFILLLITIISFKSNQLELLMIRGTRKWWSTCQVREINFLRIIFILTLRKLRRKLIDCSSEKSCQLARRLNYGGEKNEELQSLNVESTVQCTVKNEIRSFSHIKAKNLKQSALYRTFYISPGERDSQKTHDTTWEYIIGTVKLW